MHYIQCIHTYMIKSSESSRENKVIDILDTGHSNGGNYSQELAISKFNSAAQVHVKPLYEVFHLVRLVELLHQLSTTVSLGATLPRAESTLDNSPTSMVPSLRTHNANACSLMYW